MAIHKLSNSKDMHLKRGIALVGLVLFVLSLTQDAIVCNDPGKQGQISGIELFLIGGIAILGGGTLEWLVWLANPLYFFAIVFFLQNRTKSLRIGIAGTLLAFSFLLWKEVLAAESGRTMPIVSFESGYWLWISAMAVLTTGMIYYHFRKQ